MKSKKLLAIILLSLSFYFVSGVGYGKVFIPGGELLTLDFQESKYGNEPLWPLIKRMREDIGLLELYNNLLTARISYMMRNPTSFENVTIYYDSTGNLGELFPKDINTKEKICILIHDIRGYFSDRSGVALKEAFKAYLDIIYSFIEPWGVVTDMNTDIVAEFLSLGNIPLGYFYDGEYHLWEE